MKISAGGSLLTLLDDIATLLDDISVVGKLAAKRTTGVPGDDLSLNAQQASGVRANRGLPVVWSVVKGLFVNRVILVPLALLISALIPRVITPLSMVGGTLLCFEGVKKALHTLEARGYEETPEERQQRLTSLAVQDPLTFEKDKIKRAVRTDFTLSAKIVAITLGIVADTPLLNQALVLPGIALVVTVGTYGLAGTIVKLGDIGYWLAEKRSLLAQPLGKGSLVVTPWLIKTLFVVSILVMFLTGGGIVIYGISPLYHAIKHFVQRQSTLIPLVFPALLNPVPSFIIDGIVVLPVRAVARVCGTSR